MIKHDALRRALGAAWVVMFLTTLLLPVGPASGGPSPALAQDNGASPAPFVAAQGALDASADQIDVAETAAAEPPPAPLAQPEAQPAVQARASQGTLEVRQATVEASPPGREDWQAATSGQTVTEGFRIRTNASGSARLVYLDGSSTTINPSAGILVQQLQQTGGGNPITQLVQAAGTTLNRVAGLVDAGARFEVETPAATAFVRGTDFIVAEQPPAPSGAARFLFQNVSPTGGGNLEVANAGVSRLLGPGQETIGTAGEAPSRVSPNGTNAQQAQNQVSQATGAAANTQAQAQAGGAAQAAQQGAQQAAAIQFQQQQQAAAAAAAQRNLPPPLPRPPPPPPAGIFQPNVPIVFPCVTQTRTSTPVNTAVPTNTPTTTATPNATQTSAALTATPTATLPATATGTATIIPAGRTATSVAVAAAQTLTSVPSFICTPTPVATLTSATFSGRSFNVTAIVPSVNVAAGAVVPTIQIRTTRGVETFSCTPVNRFTGANNVPQASTVCIGQTLGDILGGLPVTVLFPAITGVVNATGFTPLIVTGLKPLADGTYAYEATLTDVETTGTVPPEVQAIWASAAVAAQAYQAVLDTPTRPEMQGSLVHAGFDYMRQIVEAVDRVDVTALTPPGARQPALDAVARLEPDAAPRPVDQFGSLGRPDAAHRRDGPLAGQFISDALAPFRL